LWCDCINSFAVGVLQHPRQRQASVKLHLEHVRLHQHNLRLNDATACPLKASEPLAVQLIPLCHVHPNTGGNVFHLSVLSKIVDKFSIRIHQVHDNCVVNLSNNQIFVHFPSYIQMLKYSVLRNTYRVCLESTKP